MNILLQSKCNCFLYSCRVYMLYMMARYLTIKKYIYIVVVKKDACEWRENTRSQMLMSMETQTVKDKSTSGRVRVVGFKCQINWGIVSLESWGAACCDFVTASELQPVNYSQWMLAVILVRLAYVQTRRTDPGVPWALLQWTSLWLSLRAYSLWVIQEQYWKLNDWAVLLCKFREKIIFFFKNLILFTLLFNLKKFPWRCTVCVKHSF